MLLVTMLSASLGVYATPVFQHEGTVLDDGSGAPVVGATVQILEQGEVVGEGTTADDGSYFLAVPGLGIRTVDRIIQHPGYRDLRTTGNLASFPHEHRLTPRVICRRATGNTQADVDCMGYGDVARMLREVGNPYAEWTVVDVLNDMAQSHRVDGVDEFLILGDDGQPESVGQPLLKIASSSLSTSSPATGPAIYRYRVAESSLPEPQNPRYKIGISTSCPGPSWEVVNYYGQPDNRWCSMRRSEDSCTSCCDGQMAQCTGGALALGAACGSYFGWTGWGAVGCGVGTAGGLGVCYKLARDCVSGCRRRFPCCVNQDGVILTNDIQISRHQQQSRLAMENPNGIVGGILWYDEPTDSYSIESYWDGEPVTIPLDLNTVQQLYPDEDFREINGKPAAAEGVYEPTTKVFVPTLLVEWNMYVPEPGFRLPPLEISHE